MPLSRTLHHLTKYLFYIFVSSFYSSVCLWAIRSRISMLNLKLVAYLLHSVAVEICGVISYNHLWNTKPTDDVEMDEIHHDLFRHWLESYCFHPLCKIINGHQDEPVTIRCFWFYRSNHIHSLCHERPWSRHCMQLRRGRMYQITMYLTFMTFTNKSYGIPLHGEPIISCSKFLVG